MYVGICAISIFWFPVIASSVWYSRCWKKYNLLSLICRDLKSPSLNKQISRTLFWYRHILRVSPWISRRQRRRPTCKQNWDKIGTMSPFLARTDMHACIRVKVVNPVISILPSLCTASRNIFGRARMRLYPPPPAHPPLAPFYFYLFISFARSSPTLLLSSCFAYLLFLCRSSHRCNFIPFCTRNRRNVIKDTLYRD